jgi:hypothetical protein
MLLAIQKAGSVAPELSLASPIALPFLDRRLYRPKSEEDPTEH